MVGTDNDRFVGIVTALILGVGGFGYLISRFKKLQRSLPDAYHRCRYVKHRLVEHQGSCSCMKIQFTLQAPASFDALDCESKIRYPHICIPLDSLNVHSGQESLGTYVTSSNGIKTVYFFCTCCGCHVYRLVNDVLCHLNIDLVDKATVEKLVVSYYNGVNREWTPSFAASYLSSDNTSSEIPSSNRASSFSTPLPHKSKSSDKSTSPFSSSSTPPSKHSSTTNNQNSHSTNILAVQIYGAFADLKKEETSTTWRSVSSKRESQNDSRFIEELPSSNKHKSPTTSSNSPGGSKGSTSARSNAAAEEEPSSFRTSPPLSTRNVSPNPTSTGSHGVVNRPGAGRQGQYSAPSLEQLRKLDPSNKKLNGGI